MILLVTKSLQQIPFKLVTGSSDNDAKVWELSTAAHLNTYTGQNLIIYGVAISPDGAKVATCGNDNTHV